jgi:predicted small lipoprotein YifL
MPILAADSAHPMRVAVLAVVVLLLAAGCGTKGPLYFRENPPSNVKPPRPEPFKPQPYPNQSGEDDAAGAEKK